MVKKAGQRRKKAERAKVKLKTSMKNAGRADKKKKIKGQSGIKLPKGTTEVKVDLKFKSININEGLIKQTQSLVSADEQVANQHVKRYRDVKDALSKLRHHSQFNRLEALRGLKEILKDCPERLDQSLPDTVNRIMSLAIDPESDVRSLTIEVFGLVLTSFPSNRLLAFSNVIGAHLCCALAHINKFIQRDALKILDKLLALVPAIVTRSIDKILPNCISQISERGPDQAKRKLTSDINDKFFVTEWRLNVFRRLEAVISLCDETEKCHSMPAKASNRNVKFSGELECHPMFPTSEQVVTSPMTVQAIKETFSKGRSGSLTFSWQEFGSKVCPLMLDIWCEVIGASSLSKNPNHRNQTKPLSLEELELLSRSTGVLKMLLSKMDNNVKKYQDLGLLKFIDFALRKLPFDTSARDAQRNEWGQRLNLEICCVIVDISKDPKDETSNKIYQVLRGLKINKLNKEYIPVLTNLLLTLFNRKWISESSLINELSMCLWRQDLRNKYIQNFMLELIKHQELRSLQSVSEWLAQTCEAYFNASQNDSNDFSHFEQTILYLCKRNDAEALKLFQEKAKVAGGRREEISNVINYYAIEAHCG